MTNVVLCYVCMFHEIRSALIWSNKGGIFLDLSSRLSKYLVVSCCIFARKIGFLWCVADVVIELMPDTGSDCLLLLLLYVKVVLSGELYYIFFCKFYISKVCRVFVVSSIIYLLMECGRFASAVLVKKEKCRV